MTQTKHLWLLCSLWQVVLLTCDQRSHPVEIEVAFESFPSNSEADSYTATCRPAGSPLIFSKHIDRSACSPDCRIRLHMSEDHRGYSIVLRARRNDSVLETKTFHFIPVSLSSFCASSTTSTAQLKWEPLHRQQSISTLTLYNMHTQSVTRIYSISSSVIQSKYAIKNLQPGTHYMVEVMVAIFLPQPGITLMQKLRIFMETDQCPDGWLANGRSCYTVRRSGLSWSDAMSSCTHLVGESHLADLKTLEDLLFVSSYLQSDNNLLLLWTGLNDQQEEGLPLWSDGSPYNQTNTMTLLPASQTDCFAFQRNATGPGYFLTPFFCDITLPFICQYQTPSTPASFSFDLAQVTDQHVELRWSDLSPLRSTHSSSFEIFLQYRESENALLGHDEEDGCKESEGKNGSKTQSSFRKTVKVKILHSSRGVTVTGLSPGSIYFFTLQVSLHAGPSWILGQIQTAYMRPLPPQDISVGSITASQITLHWMLPDTQCTAGWAFAVQCEDVSLRQERVVGNISRVYGTNRKWFYTAMIGGLDAYTRYRIQVFTIAQFGIWSCGQAPLTVRTAVKPPADLLMFSKNDSLSACWTVPPSDPPDAYYVTTQSFNSPAASSLWINDSSADGLRKDESICVNLGTFTPSHTYEVAVVAMRGNDRSERSITVYTTAPMPVQVAVPLTVGTNYTQLYVQAPRVGLIDGVKVCSCLGFCNRTCKELCDHTCDWHSLPTGIFITTISSLTPGSQYQLNVYSTVKERVGPPFYTHPIKTSLVPPSRVREGVVTDTSIELLWDPAPGKGLSYEVICHNCGQALKVQKVFSQSAVFSGLIPGSLYHFAVRAEKESFADSSPVSINITAVPGQVEVSLVNKTTSSICISWSTARGLLSSFILSIKNTTTIQELIISHQERRSHNFQGLVSGTKYTVEVLATNGERRSKPSTVILYTLPGMPKQVVTSKHPVTSIFLTWRPPTGQVDKYKLAFGLLTVDRKLWTGVFVESTSYEIRELSPGSDYGVSIQSVLGSDSSHAANREFSTRPARLCRLHLDKVDSSSISVHWDGAPGEFDFHRLTVAGASITQTLIIPKVEQVAVVTGLLDGCSYNVSAKRVRGETAGSAAFLTVTTVPKPVRGVRLVNISGRAFSLRWLQAEGCVDHYQVNLVPNHGAVTFHPTYDGYIQADVVDVSPGTQYSVTVSADSSSKSSPGVSRMIITKESVPGPPLTLEGEAVGSNGILLSWTMQSDANNIDGYVIRYKEVCPYTDPSFTQVTKYLDIPEILITDFTSGSTYHIQVAAMSPAGTGPFSKPLYIKTSESPPGLVTNVTAYAQNHTFVVVTWFLPHRINGLITKFAVKAKHVRTGQTVRILEVNAEEIMTGALPHCNDAADILSRATPSPLEITASSPPITLSAVPPAASWNVPISVGVDQLRPYTAYLFEVSAFTSDGEGQVASTMVRMPESAPEDPPDNFSVMNMTSRSIYASWNSPSKITGKFSYVLYLYGPTGFLYDNSTWDMHFLFTGLTPYTMYRVAVRAKAAGEVGPAAQKVIVTPAEAPSAVQNLEAVAEDSVSIRVSWRSPAQPNGPITQYRLQVLAADTLLQDITLSSGNITDSYENETLPPHVDNTMRRRKRSDELSPVTSPPTFTATVSARTPPTAMTASSFARSESISTDHTANTDFQPTLHLALADESSPGYDSESITQSFDNVSSRTSVRPVTSVSRNTSPPWLMEQSHTDAVTSATSALGLTPGQLRLSTRDVSVTGNISTRSGAVTGTPGVTVREEVVDVLSEELSYLVSDLNPFTEYVFRVTASTTAGEGPAADITEKTSEQVPSSVLEVSYQNISSTSILVNWIPPLNPNGRITHYSIYGLNLRSNQAMKWVTNTTTILISDLDKYTGYKLRVAASTAVGESTLSEDDDVFVFTLEDEPDSPPENLSVVDMSPSTATLTWSAPEKANGVIQYYEVFYENDSYFAVMNTTSNRVTLTSLKPFSFYNVSVRAYTRYGNGNQTSITLNLLSGEDVPGSPPYGLSYESISPSEVNVSWYAPLQPNGIVTHYSLELWNSTHHLNLTSPANSLHITHLRKYTQYRIVVQAHTRAGPGNYSSEPLNITTLEDAPDTPPQFLQARKLSDYEVELSWEPPHNANSEILYYIVRVWNETAETWQNVTETSVVINVDSESRYNASVSSWTRLGDGGVLISISFSTTEAEPFDPPQNVTVVNVTASSVTLMWQPPTEPNGIIVHYTIYYTDNSTVIEKRIGVSDLPPRYFPDSPFIYTLTRLIGGSNYTLWMTSSTVQGDGGVESEPIELLLPEDVPSDPVSNLTAQIFSSTIIIVSWDPPMEPNGRPYYILTLQEAGIFPNMSSPGTVAVNKTIKQTTTDNIFLFTRLRKYFPYVLTVTPATGAGPAYNQTSTMYLRTDDDIPSSPPLLLSTRNLSSSSIEVVWQRPLEANGEITEYTLTLSGPGGTNATQVPNTSVILTKLASFTAYNLTIIASTRKGAGPSLLVQLHTDEAGPSSPPRNLTIYNHTAVSVWLTWEPPLEPNGVVIKYGFRIQDLITQTVTHRNSSGSSTTEHLSGFRPHSSYEISVYSYTRVGHGNQFSSPVTFTTNESVSDAVGNLSCSGLSWDSVELSWEVPANPNGQILFYEITAEVDMQTFNHQAYAPQYKVAGLSPDQEYAFTVAAVNSAGPGNSLNCTAFTLSESVPTAPRFLSISEVTATNVTLQWTAPVSVPGLLKEYHVVAQLISAVCEPNTQAVVLPTPEDSMALHCVEDNFNVSVNASDGAEEASVILQSLAKYRYYRFKVTAVTNAGPGEYAEWIYAYTLAGNPDAPPRDLKVTPTSTSLQITWEVPAVLSGPTSYLVQVDGPGVNISIVRVPGELTTVFVTNLTAFNLYAVTVTAFTGSVEDASSDGKVVGPIVFQTLEEEPKDPPKNVTVSAVPERVNLVRVSFSPPEKPNGNITAYYVLVYEKDQLVKNMSLDYIHGEPNMLFAFVEGLKGGHTYSIQIAARNGAGRSPLSPHVQITTGIKAPSKPTQRPQAVLGQGGVAMVTHRSITIHMPACFYSDDNGPITKIQVIVAESGVRDSENLTNWKGAYFHHPAPYLTDAGFPNPTCLARDRAAVMLIEDGRSVSGDDPSLLNHTITGTYMIGENDNCMGHNDTDHFCNGPLKSNTVYVFKFRATNIKGQYTDSEFSEYIRTTVDGLLTKEEQIILGVLLSFFLAVFLILLICCSVRIHQRKKEGGTYSPREAEIIETKCKLDQLIAVADMELKQEKLNRYSSFFFRRKEIYVIQLLSYRKSLKPVNKKSFLQHVEDLCATDNAKFQEEFSDLPKLLPDLATTDADLPWNKSKNRFLNIKPYNNNRVKLLSEPGMAGSDYINASFVSGYLCPNEFIATQGPLPSTVADFWRMIWETGTRTVAMLTQCYEKGRIRCHKYWPEDNKPMTVFSDILISKVSEEVLPDWTVRTLKVEKHGHYILVKHFNYTSWPEHGVPESCSTLIKFVKAVRVHRHDNSTIVVHCSAGVGRTGVFIALDHLIQHVRDHDFVDIYGLVAELRSERMCMVQNLAQYIFLHQSTLELLNNKGNSQSIWFVNYSALEKMDSLDAMEGDVELEWEETTM